MRPLACALWAAIEVIPSSARARPNCVGLRRSASCSSSVRGLALAGLEDAVPIAVQGERDAVPADRLAQDGQIAGRILLLTEGRPGDDPGRVVDGGDEGQARATLAQPIVATSVGLEEHARLGHPVAAAAVTRRASTARAGDPGCPQDPPDADPTQRDPVAFGEQLGQVAVVGPVVSATGERADLLAGRLVDPPW